MCISICINYSKYDMQIGETAVHHASWEGKVEIIDALLRAGADPTIRERVSIMIF